MKQKALQFATEKHKGQTRKDGVTEYIVHPVGVAKIVETYGGDEAQICIAKLHDVVEDCDCTIDEIREQFGDDIANGVQALTNTSREARPDLNRAARKALDNQKLAAIDVRYKLVKLADIYYNVTDMVGFPRGFAFKFLTEKRTQASFVREGSEALFQNILASISRQEARLVV